MPEDPEDVNQEGAANGADGSAKKTRGSHRLPQASMEEVRPLVRALDELNGPASKNRVIDYAGMVASAGGTKTRWAALGYYGFRDGKRGGQFEITDRGRAFLGDDAAASQEAKQHALVGTGFRAVIQRFAARPVNSAALQARLKEDFDVPDGAAEKLAALLVEGAEDAGLIVDGAWKPGPIEAACSAVPALAPETNGVTPKANGSGPAAPAGSKPSAKPAKPAGAKPAGSAEEQPPAPPAPALGVAVEVKIDAEKHTPEQIGAIVRELREALSSAV